MFLFVALSGEGHSKMIGVTQLKTDSVAECIGMGKKRRVPSGSYSLLKSRVPRSRNTLVAIAALTSVLFACSDGQEERTSKARLTEAGTTVAVLVSKVGPPSVERVIDRDNPADPCADDERNGRAFEYHLSYDSVTRQVLKLLGRPTVTAMAVVCLDTDSRVTSTHSLFVN